MRFRLLIPSSHLILCHPLLLLPSIFPSNRVFSNESGLYIRWPKYWSFSFSISPSNEYSGLISFRIHWLDLLALQGTQESSATPQFKSINSSAFLYLLAILWNSAYKWVYFSFSPLPLASLFFSAVCKNSSDNHTFSEGKIHSPCSERIAGTFLNQNMHPFISHSLAFIFHRSLYERSEKMEAISRKTEAIPLYYISKSGLSCILVQCISLDVSIYIIQLFKNDFLTPQIDPPIAGQQRWWEQEIKINGNIQKGELITYNLTELIKPEAYEVRLTPLTKFGEGDSTIRVIKYSAPVNPHLREFHCGFEDGNICLFTQDDTDNFDWTKQSTATRNTKYTPNTGPNADRSGSKEGVLNVYLRLKGQTTIENPLWSSSGNKGQRWNEAHVNIYPITSFQLIFEGIRGPGIEGDIAIDDVSIAEGECAKQDLTTK
ncbi:hypothetical protein FD754_020734, partial [Muntiacus muntjak]